MIMFVPIIIGILKVFVEIMASPGSGLSSGSNNKNNEDNTVAAIAAMAEAERMARSAAIENENLKAEDITPNLTTPKSKPAPPAIAALTFSTPKTTYDRATSYATLYDNLTKSSDWRDICKDNNFTANHNENKKQLQFTSNDDKNISITVESQKVSASTFPESDKAKQSMAETMISFYMKSIQGSSVLAHHVDGDPKVIILLTKELAKRLDGNNNDKITINGATLNKILEREPAPDLKAKTPKTTEPDTTERPSSRPGHSS